MGKVVKLERFKKIKNEKLKKPALPNKYYKLSETSKIIYLSNMQTCIGLYLIKSGEYPSLEELEAMPVYKARKIMKQLNDLFLEKAEERNISLKRKTFMQEAAEAIDRILCINIKEHKKD